jgi:hypothetical protein
MFYGLAAVIVSVGFSHAMLAQAAKPDEWIGIVQDVEGKWDLFAKDGTKTQIKNYLPVPSPAWVKITEQPGLALGRLTIALKDGSLFSRCCSPTCPRRDSDCGERIEIKYNRMPQEPWGPFLEQIGALLSRGPERFTPVISGRAVNPPTVSPDGVFVAVEDSLDVNKVLLGTADALQGQTSWASITRLRDGEPTGTAVRARLGEGSSPIPLKPGLYQFSVWIGSSRPTDSGLNTWTLIVRSKKDEAISKYESLVEATSGLDLAVAGALRRAYLSVLARNFNP